MTEVYDTNVRQRDRSPAYPIVPLDVALGRLKEFETHFKRTAARPEKMGEAWGITAKAYADRVAAGLRYFGLLEYRGTGKNRNVVISEEGRKYLLAQQEKTKHEIAKAAALRPKQIAKFWNAWGAERPADTACLDELIQNHGFSEAGARDFLKVYDATITYAKLSDSDKSPDLGDNVDDESEPAMQEAIFDTRSKPGLTPANRPMTMHEKFALDEGEVTLSYPAELSAESFKDLEDRLQIILRGAKRRVIAAKPDDGAAN